MTAVEIAHYEQRKALLIQRTHRSLSNCVISEQGTQLNELPTASK